MSYADLTEAQKVRARAASKRWKERNPRVVTIQEERRREKIRSDPEYAAKRLKQQQDSSANYRTKEADKVKAAVRRCKLKRAYGISPEEYDARKEAAKGKCALCRQPTESLHLDHDHKTGKLRGMLCGNCNRGLGMFNDNPKLLEQAAEYLRLHRKR